ncbi:MAG: polysaccharide deacetylase family protein [Bacillota bacterium]
MRLLRRFGCRFVVIRLELVLIYSILLLMLVLQVGLGVSYDKLLRAFNGVPRGVVFEGRDVSGRYRDELYDLVQRYALDFDLESASAVAALYDSSVDHAAAAIDVEATVQRILKAQPGSYVTAVIAREVQRPDPRTATDIRRVDIDHKAVAFAVNVAWGDEYIEPMLDLFDRYDARATFFFVGTWARSRPDLVKVIAEAGHEIANHGYEHVHVSNASATTIKKLVQDNQNLLHSITGVKTRLFAPPYGEVNPVIVRAAAEVGHYTIMWDVDTIDWQLPSPSVITSRVVSKIRPGSIVLMHPTAPTVEALSKIFEILSSQGYRVVTVSDLIDAAQMQE